MENLEEVAELLHAVKYEIVPYTRGKGIDVGVSRLSAYRHFIPVRKRGDPLVPEDAKSAYWVDDFDEGLNDFDDGALDFVFAWGVTVTPTMYLHFMRSLRVGGHYVWVHDGREIAVWRKADTGELVPVLPQRPEKSACVVRYGAIGDALQAGCIVAALKREGYHVTYMCEPLGEQVMRHDPNIDAFIVQDPDQVPNPELPQYFAHWRPKFDKFVNLCESIEGTLICLPGRAKFEFPKDARHKLCNFNYHEFMCDLAEMPLHAEHHFYPTDEERAWAENRVKEIGQQQNPDWVIGKKWVKPFVVLWALAGSGVHKFYPHQDAVIARLLLEIPHAHVILTGGPECKILEVGWEEEPRVHSTSGELKLRQALALAQQVDLVVGPETGILNSVAFEPMAKIVLLSHSTHENLTKHWVNTEPISSEVTPCYPCHQLHQDSSHCPRHEESKSALCQHDIPADVVWAAVQRAYVATGTVRNLLEAA